MQSLVASLTVLAIMALGFAILLRSARGRRLDTSRALSDSGRRPRMPSGRLQDGVNAIVTVGLVSRFFADRAGAAVVDPVTAGVAIVGVLTLLAVVPDLQVLIGIAALGVFLIELPAALAAPILAGLALGGVAHAAGRRMLDR